MLATTTAMLLILAMAPIPRSALGLPLRFGDKERLQQQQQQQELQQQLIDKDVDNDTESDPSDVDSLADLPPLDSEDYVTTDDERAEGEQLQTYSGDGAALFGNWSQEALSAEMALFVELLARVLREMHSLNSSQNLNATPLSLSSARAAYQRLCGDHFFRHFFGISSCGGIGRDNDVGESVGHLETEIEASAPADGGKGVGLRSATANALDTFFGAYIDEDISLFSEP